MRRAEDLIPPVTPEDTQAIKNARAALEAAEQATRAAHVAYMNASDALFDAKNAQKDAAKTLARVTGVSLHGNISVCRSQVAKIDNAIMVMRADGREVTWLRWGNGYCRFVMNTSRLAYPVDGGWLYEDHLWLEVE